MKGHNEEDTLPVLEEKNEKMRAIEMSTMMQQCHKSYLQHFAASEFDKPKIKK